MHSVEESLLQSHHSFGREIDTASGREITTDYPLYRLSALLSLAVLQPTILSTDYPLCCLWRYSNQLCCVLYSIQRYYNREFGLLCLPILVQPTIRSALSVDATIDYPLYPAYRYYNRLSALPTISYTLSGFTPIDHLLHSVCQHHYKRLSSLIRDSDGIISERDSQLCLAILQPTIRCASLLPL
jgi:hypothetical protein